MTSRRTDAGQNEAGSARAKADREAVTRKRGLRCVCPAGVGWRLIRKNGHFDGIRALVDTAKARTYNVWCIQWNYNHRSSQAPMALTDATRVRHIFAWNP